MARYYDCIGRAVADPRQPTRRRHEHAVAAVRGSDNSAARRRDEQILSAGALAMIVVWPVESEARRNAVPGDPSTTAVTLPARRERQGLQLCSFLFFRHSPEELTGHWSGVHAFEGRVILSLNSVPSRSLCSTLHAPRRAACLCASPTAASSRTARQGKQGDNPRLSRVRASVRSKKSQTGSAGSCSRSTSQRSRRGRREEKTCRMGGACRGLSGHARVHRIPRASQAEAEEVEPTE